MTFGDIYITLKKYSCGYEEFMINYNELIPDILKAKEKNPEEWTEFIKGKNHIREMFKDFHCSEYKSRIIRNLRLLKNVYDYDITDEIKKTETAFKPYFKFKHKLDLLR